VSLFPFVRNLRQANVMHVSKRCMYDGAVCVLRRMYDGLKRTRLLYVVPFGRSFRRVLRVLESYDKVSNTEARIITRIIPSRNNRNEANVSLKAQALQERNFWRGTKCSALRFYLKLCFKLRNVEIDGH